MKLYIEIFVTVFAAMIVLLLLIKGFIQMCFEEPPFVILSLVVSAIVAMAIADKELKK